MVFDFNTLALSLISFIGSLIAVPVGGSALFVIPAMLLIGFDGMQTLILSRVFAIFSMAGCSIYFAFGQRFDWKQIFHLLWGNVLGYALSAKLATSLDIDTLTTIVPWVLLVGAIFLVKDFRVTKPHVQKRLYFMIPLFGFLFGVYSGIGGSGTGALSVILMVILLGWSMHKAIVNMRLAEMIASIALLIFYLMFGAELTGYEIPVVLFSFIGGLVGAKITLKSKPVWLKRALLVLVVISIIKTSWPILAEFFQKLT